MKKITVLLICVLFYASVIQIVASTDEITEARISGENDAQGFQWKWFAASYMTTNASVIAIMLTYWTNEKLLHNSLNNIQPACCYTIYGAYVLTPTAVAIIDSPTPPADRLLGKSSEWVNAYTKAYKNVTRQHRTEATLIGCMAGGVVLAATVTFLGGNTPGGF
jgi:hypothetical protein